MRLDSVTPMRELVECFLVAEDDIEEGLTAHDIESRDSQAEIAWRMVDEYREKLENNDSLTYRDKTNPYLDQLLTKIRR